jgi:hypothetical protein
MSSFREPDPGIGGQPELDGWIHGTHVGQFNLKKIQHAKWSDRIPFIPILTKLECFV